MAITRFRRIPALRAAPQPPPRQASGRHDVPVDVPVFAAAVEGRADLDLPDVPGLRPGDVIHLIEFNGTRRTGRCCSRVVSGRIPLVIDRIPVTVIRGTGMCAQPH